MGYDVSVARIAIQGMLSHESCLSLFDEAQDLRMNDDKEPPGGLWWWMKTVGVAAT